MEQSPQQPSNMQSNESYIRGMAQQADSSFLMYQLETDEILEEIEMNLRGFDWDPKQRGYMKKRTQIVNDDGISVIMTLIKSEVNRTKMLSDFEEKEIANIVQEFELNMVDLLASKYQDWEIDYRYLTGIRAMLGNAVFATYKRALQGGERKFLKGETKRVETYSEKESGQSNPFSFLRNKIGKW